MTKNKLVLTFDKVKSKLSLDNKTYAKILEVYTDQNFRGSYTRNKIL